ncbi:MAG: hypothetical protein JW913_20790 [Chitinispirillaceae bacterium]|nr:hypothetical protein [Chitinispirillaceae bacterium]
MIQAICRSIAAIHCTAFAWCATVGGEPLSVVDSFQNRLGRITTFTASVERHQTYRGARRLGRGSVVFDRSRGNVYDYRTPGRFLFFSSDSAAWGVNRKKRTGWKTSGPPGPQLRQRVDPLFRLLRLCAIDKKHFIYRGNSGDLLLFSLPLDDGGECCAGFDADSFQCRIIEMFDSTGALTDKTVFAYGRLTSDALLPAAITVSEPIGTEVSVDSILLKKPRINVKVQDAVFTRPPAISWKAWRGGTLFQQQFDTVPGR